MKTSIVEFCHSSIDIEVDGEDCISQVYCSLKKGHPENHSARIWWNNEDLVEDLHIEELP